MKTAICLLGLSILQMNIVYSQCSPSTSSVDLDIGNVRAKIFINGDMWWDLVGNAKYEVPKGSGKNSLSAGALWIGGKDIGGNLKVAAQTYRQGGSDFWPGPIDTSTIGILPVRCLHYDQHWKITRQEVSDFINGSPPSNAIIYWPGNGNAAYGEYHYLAPFFDRNGDGIYDYNDGDYPKYEFGTQSPNINQRLNGDQTIWWVFNDVANIHTETSSLYPIGLEIRAQAYAFCTPDTDLNNATFYTYEIINRSTTILYETYFGNFTDPDLGNYLDDYIGCDVGRNLGYAYNGDIDDDGVDGYGTQLAAVGVDLLGGPIADPFDFIDNNHDGDTDEVGETILMSGFLVYNYSITSITGNPFYYLDYYNYLDNYWKDGSCMVYGGNGYSSMNYHDSSIYMFPGNSDPLHYGTRGINPGFDWSEMQPAPGSQPNIPGNRRFLMSTGKLTLPPGSVNYFTKATVWARVNSGIDSSVQALKNADDKIQSFFDSYYNNISSCPLNIGVEEIQQINYSVFPSPATDYLIINLNDVTSKSAVAIFSVDGKLVFKSKDLVNGDNKIITSNWTTGTYYFKLTNGSKQLNGKFNIIN